MAPALFVFDQVVDCVLFFFLKFLCVLARPSALEVASKWSATQGSFAFGDFGRWNFDADGLY